MRKNEPRQPSPDRAEARADALQREMKKLVTVCERAIRLSVKHPDFKLYAMEPMYQALKTSHAALEADTPSARSPGSPASDE
jgi:hypothetical protein